METSIECSLQSTESDNSVVEKKNELFKSSKVIMVESGYRRWPKGWKNEIKYRILYFSPV